MRLSDQRVRDARRRQVVRRRAGPPEGVMLLESHTTIGSVVVE